MARFPIPTLGAKDSELRPDLDCGSIAPVFRFTWELRQDGQIVDAGSSARVGTVLTSNGATEAMVVGFPARTKHQYEVALKFSEDAQNAKTADATRDPCTSPRSTANQAAKEVTAKSTKTYSHVVAGRSRGPLQLAFMNPIYLRLLIFCLTCRDREAQSHGISKTDS
jgi:hypothetical protein